MEAVNFLLKMRQTGMGIRTLKGYVDAVREGRDTLDFRASMLKSHRQDVEDQIAQLQTCLSIIDKKLDYYASEIGSDCSSHNSKTQ